jgi:hypothetical protein
MTPIVGSVQGRRREVEEDGQEGTVQQVRVQARRRLHVVRVRLHAVGPEAVSLLRSPRLTGTLGKLAPVDTVESRPLTHHPWKEVKNMAETNCSSAGSCNCSNCCKPGSQCGGHCYDHGNGYHLGCDAPK